MIFSVCQHIQFSLLKVPHSRERKQHISGYDPTLYCYHCVLDHHTFDG